MGWRCSAPRCSSSCRASCSRRSFRASSRARGVRRALARARAREHREQRRRRRFDASREPGGGVGARPRARGAACSDARACPARHRRGCTVRRGCVAHLDVRARASHPLATRRDERGGPSLWPLRAARGRPQRPRPVRQAGHARRSLRHDADRRPARPRGGSSSGAACRGRSDRPSAFRSRRSPSSSSRGSFVRALPSPDTTDGPVVAGLALPRRARAPRRGAVLHQRAHATRHHAARPLPFRGERTAQVSRAISPSDPRTSGWARIAPASSSRFSPISSS